MVYILKFRFLMEWYDYRWGSSLQIKTILLFVFSIRLKYHNLKTERSNNLLSRSEIDNLWIPFVVFSNTENSEATKGDDDTEVTVTKEGTFTESPLEVMEEINIFEGSDNKITFQQVYAKEFKCVYLLQLYPFDTQERKFYQTMPLCVCKSVSKSGDSIPRHLNNIQHKYNFSTLKKCKVILELRDLEKATIKLVPHTILMESEKELSQYTIVKWSLEYRSSRLYHFNNH